MCSVYRELIFFFALENLQVYLGCTTCVLGTPYYFICNERDNINNSVEQVFRELYLNPAWRPSSFVTILWEKHIYLNTFVVYKYTREGMVVKIVGNHQSISLAF